MRISRIMYICQEDGGSAPDTDEASYLLVLTHSEAAEALTRARALRSRRPPLPALEASMACQAIGIALRDLGHLEDGLAELRRPLRLARASGQPQRQADVRASLGLTLALGGSTSRGLAQLDRAVLAARGVLAGRVLMRRADVLAIVGRREEALADLNRVVTILHRHRDYLWEARARTRVVLAQARRACGAASLSVYRLACSAARQLDARRGARDAEPVRGGP